jgi:hypothetical protein
VKELNQRGNRSQSCVENTNILTLFPVYKL